jgi:hypothetical protein
MASLVLTGDTSGAITVSAPAVAGTNTLTLQAATATNSVNTLATAVASTSGTSIDFTGLPSWIKRFTVMFSGVSTSGTSIVQIQLGSGSVTTTGYNANASFGPSAGQYGTATTGFVIEPSASATAATVRYSSVIFSLLSANTWVSQGNLYTTATTANITNVGQISLSGVLDRVRLTTVNGTDTFDAGSVNILYEG